MKKISIWAKNHVFATRIIISIIHLLLILIAFYISQNLQFNFSFSALCIVILIIIAGKIFYPFARRKSYVLHKTTLFVTSTCFFLVMCFAMKHNFRLSSYNQNALSAISLPVDSNKVSSLKQISSYKDYKALSKSERKAFRKELKKEIRTYKKIPQPNRPSAQDAVLIFLIVLCGLGLLFLLSILVCGISCGGISGGAILLTLLGMGGIGVGLYFIIRSLHRNLDKENGIMDKQSTNNNRNNNLFPVITI